MRRISADQIGVNPHDPRHRAIIGGILREAVKARFKNHRSEMLGFLWQDYDRFCQMPEEAAEQIRWIRGRAKVELSGGINLENVRAYSDAGAMYISIGAITHSARAVDINFGLVLD